MPMYPGSRYDPFMQRGNAQNSDWGGLGGPAGGMGGTLSTGGMSRASGANAFGSMMPSSMPPAYSGQSDYRRQPMNTAQSSGGGPGRGMRGGAGMQADQMAAPGYNDYLSSMMRRYMLQQDWQTPYF